MTGVVERLKDACVGQPAKIDWPQRVLHDAIDEIEHLRFCLTSRDKFIGDSGLWQEFVNSLPRNSP